MNDKIQTINENTLKAEKCLEMDKVEFASAQSLWKQQLDSLDKKLQELVKLTDTCFKAKENQINELNLLKEEHKNLEREFYKLKIDHEEREQAFSFLYEMSSDEFKENQYKNKENRRKNLVERMIKKQLMIWELNTQENTSIRIDNMTQEEQEEIRMQTQGDTTFVTEFEIVYISENNQDNVRKNEFMKKKEEVTKQINDEIMNDSFVSDASEEIGFVDTNDFQDKFDTLRQKNQELLLENDEIIQKIDIYKNSNDNIELKKNITQLKKQLTSLETEYKLKHSMYEQMVLKQDQAKDTESNDYNQLTTMCKSLYNYMGGQTNYKLKTQDILMFIQDLFNEQVKKQNDLDENERAERQRIWDNIKRKDKIEKNRISQMIQKEVKSKDVDSRMKSMKKPCFKKNIIIESEKEEVKEVNKRMNNFEDFLVE